jgi:SAM-dependent methyltransferase
VLEHVEDDEAALRELVRILRPGGHLLVILPAHEKLFPGTKHLRVYDPDAFAERLEHMGLQRVAVDEHQRFDRPFKHSFLILQSRRGPLRKLALEGTKVALFLPAALLSWRALAKVDEALARVGAPSSSVAYLFRKP